ncbi:MAG: glycosyltransferase family 1 protein [Isosphaeraceae bacterium]
MVSRSDLIFCDSESSRRDLSSFYPGSERKSRVLYLGHDRARFLPVDGEASRQAPSGGTRPTVAMVGQLEPRKNQSGMLRACRFLESHAGSDRIRLLLIGGRPTSSPYGFLEDQARQHVDVMYTGYLPDQDLASLLRQCDVFVFPSLWEGFGLPILEAMSAGVMVVTSELSSMPEVGGEHAFYCDPHDPRSIAAAVSHALSLAPSERARRIDQARDWAGSFTWERMTDALEDQILELLVDGRRDVEPAGRTPRDAPRATALAGSHEQAAPLGGMPGQLQH